MAEDQSSTPEPPFPPQTQPAPGLESEMDPPPDYGEESYRGSGKLDGKRALITGGDSGIGRAVALAFAREGADVAISYLPEEETDAAETARVVEASGRRCLRLPGDIRDEAHCREMVRRTREALGGLDILVNNASFQTTHDAFEDFPTSELDRIVRTNFYATFWLTQEALTAMGEGASVIVTTSIQAYRPKAFLAPYACTKAAQRALIQALAPQLAERGIRINGVAPGPVWTPLIPMSFTAEQVKEFGKNNPMKRPAQPAEVAPVFVFLAGDEASFVTGQIYGVTGGEPTA